MSCSTSKNDFNKINILYNKNEQKATLLIAAIQQFFYNIGANFCLFSAYKRREAESDRARVERTGAAVRRGRTVQSRAHAYPPLRTAADRDALIEGLEQNQDFFSLLLNDEEIKREVLGIFTEEIYNSLKKAAEE